MAGENRQSPGDEKEAAQRGNRPAAPANPRLGKAMLAGAREVWDRLGLAVAISLTWAILLSLPLSIGSLLPPSWHIGLRAALVALAAALLLPAPTAGAFHVAHRVFSHEEAGYADFWRGARRLCGPATRLGLIHGVVALLLAVNMAFYARLGGVAGSIALLLCLYLLLCWSMMALYHLPLLAAQEAGVFDEPGRKATRGARGALRRAFFLALGEPATTFGLLAMTLLWTALCVGLIVLLPLLYMGALALLTTPPVRALLVKYEALPAPVETPVEPDEEFRFPQG